MIFLWERTADNAIVLTKKNHIKEVDSIEEQGRVLSRKL
jgi:hypothetical protein